MMNLAQELFTENVSKLTEIHNLLKRLCLSAKHLLYNDEQLTNEPRIIRLSFYYSAKKIT
jgi:hypothetical protein